MSALLISERVVLESLNYEAKTFDELLNDVGLNEVILFNSLQGLLLKEFIIFDRGVYKINASTKGNWEVSINELKNMKEEVKEIFVSLVNSFFKESAKSQEKKDSCLKLKKVWMTREDEKIFSSLLTGLDSFVSDLVSRSQKNKAMGPLARKKVIVWGTGIYGNVISDVLS